MEYLTTKVLPPRPEVPEDWSFEEADQELDDLIFQWRTLTIGVLEKAFCFYFKLAIVGQRTDLSPIGERLPTWTEWVKAKGFGVNTLTRHFVKLKWIEPQIKPPPDLAVGKYFVLYADPPWQYDNSGLNESAAQQYPTMETQQICQLPVRDLVDEKAVLFLWVTNPFLQEGLEVCRSWGFEYKTNFVWIKNKGPSMGWFCHSRHELLFVATHGEGVHPTEKMISWFESEVTRHSQKPDKVYEMIETMYTGPYIELFARRGRPGWDNWGNELEAEES